MYNLTPQNTSFVYQSLFVFLIIGIVFFSLVMVAMVVFFGWSIKDMAKNSKSLLVMMLLSLSIPLTVGSVYQKINLSSQAKTDIKLENLELVKVGEDVLVNFRTSKPVMAFLSYTDLTKKNTYSIFPLYSLSNRIEHSILVSNVGQQGGEAVLMINSKPFLINNKPIIINKNLLKKNANN